MSLSHSSRIIPFLTNVIEDDHHQRFKWVVNDNSNVERRNPSITGIVKYLRVPTNNTPVR